MWVIRELHIPTVEDQMTKVPLCSTGIPKYHLDDTLVDVVGAFRHDACLNCA
jgi:hypothetical protein